MTAFGNKFRRLVDILLFFAYNMPEGGVSMYTADLIAKWFLRKDLIVSRMGDSEGISNLKLQKLLYYAQGVYCGMVGSPLFRDELVAWTHGPVVESVYHAYKSFGSIPISIEDTEGLTKEDTENLEAIDDETVGILEMVYEAFGQFSAWKLREMSHQDSPWIETEQGWPISVEAIKKCFLEKYLVEGEE